MQSHFLQRMEGVRNSRRQDRHRLHRTRAFSPKLYNTNTFRIKNLPRPAKSEAVFFGNCKFYQSKNLKNLFFEF